ncbi:neutral zinc metallopeptidase [Nonomuraea sp. NPDC050643]|uniref:neutral zinc metallopeptidase n=1 Tax=Nonomuraea sp. NPDC050643 TaxID=3155660 RepID=UPI0033CE9E88
MKPLKIAALLCAFIVPLTGMSAAGAATYPVLASELIANPLYESGRLAQTACDEKPIKRNNRKLARAYFDGVIACLESTWEKHLTDAGLSYTKLRVRHVAKIPKKYCGYTSSKGDSEALYCEGNRTVLVELGKDWLNDVSDLWLFHQASFTYAEHVQNLAGISAAYEELPYDKRAELLEQSRRLSLQTDCLSTVFLQSVWPLKGRTTKDWNYLLSLQEGDLRGEERWWGKSSSVRYWMKQGFATSDPASCNTWTASSSKVA